MKRNSIGNDIVALKKIDAEKTRQQKFYSKFLTATEVDLYKNNNLTALPFEYFIWLCWSIKEAVFKFQKRLNPEFIFSFREIQVQQFDLSLNTDCLLFKNGLFEKDYLPNKNVYTSLTLIDSIPFYSRSFIEDDFIYTITADKLNYNDLYWGIRKIEDSAYNIQSLSVRKFASQKLTEILATKKIDILKSENSYPFVKQYPQLPLSFTHHACLVGYAFLANETA